MPNCTVSNLSQGCLQAVFDELNKLFNLIKTPIALTTLWKEVAFSPVILLNTSSYLPLYTHANVINSTVSWLEPFLLVCYFAMLFVKCMSLT